MAAQLVANHVMRDRLWESRKLAQCSRTAALAYPWIFLVADDHGRFEYHPRRIWTRVFGNRSDVGLKEVTTWLAEYERVGLLVRYHVGGDLAYWYNFKGRPPSERRPSAYADPKDFIGSYVLPTAVVGIPYHLTEQNGSEQIRAEIDGARRRTSVTAGPSNDIPENRAPIEAYNATFGTKLGSTPGNLRAAVRAFEAGYTLEQMRQTFEAVKARASAFAAWCASHDREFEFLIRPDYTNKRTGNREQAAIDKILNELATGRKESE